jgi:hypothetical protein
MVDNILANTVLSDAPTQRKHRDRPSPHAT